MDIALPEECLLHMISFAANHSGSLHALLLTNTTFFRLVAPILYRNPWSYIETQKSSQDQLRRQARILHLLLSCIPETLQELPYYRSRKTLPPSPSIDYLSYYTFHSERVLQNINPVTIRPTTNNNNNNNNNNTLFPKSPPELLQTTSIVHGPEQTTLLNPQKSKSIRSKATQLSRPLTISELQAKLHLGLIRHSAQHISTISFSIHKMYILQSLTTQLSSLLHLELSKKLNRSDISSAHNFIITHRQHFSTLQEIKIITDKSDKSDLSCLIQAMEEPRVVDVSSWSNADQYLSQFPLRKCRVLLMALRPSSSSLNPAILARSTQLQTLRIYVFHRDIFSWAFTSRHPQIPGIKGSSGERMQLDKSQAQFYASNPGLVSVSLCGVDGALAPALLDVCDAFRGTLNTLAGMSWFLEPSVSHLSWNWEMPCLTRLDLEGTIAVNFDLESLRYCPFLQVLRLNIARKIPSNWNVLEKAKQLTKVSSHLRHLNLGGWWGLSDSVLTQTLLPVLKRLHTLDIMWCFGPTRTSILELMRLLPSLTWLGVSATKSEQDEIQSLKSTLGLNMEIDIFVEVD